MRARLATLVLVAGLGLTACGGGSSDDPTLQSGAGSSDGPTGVATTDPATSAPAQGACTATTVVPAPAGSTTDLAKKPTVPTYAGAVPPCGVQVSDVVTGKGAGAVAGNMLTVKYVGVFTKGGKQFDASWDRGQDFPFTLGAMQVITGWDVGLVGMKAGGRRQLVIPPGEAYGDQDANGIPGGSTLTFVVDLVKIG